jgi:L-ascorbate metabolism protein UlaG (beta-lactamase superfamily)
MPEPVNRTALFDPGVYSEDFIDIDSLEFLDDIIITHSHADHFSPALVGKLVAKFPSVRVTAPPDVAQELNAAGIKASSDPSDGIEFFDALHEEGEPMFEAPEQRAVHYLDRLTYPGDSHSFAETKAILALPVQAPWGSTRNAVKLALQLKPKYIVPIHDWHWNDAAREQIYGRFERLLTPEGITFLKLKNSEPIILDV